MNETRERAELYCYVCGKVIVGTPSLVTEADRTDRPFVIHGQCEKYLDKEVRTASRG